MIKLSSSNENVQIFLDHVHTNLKKNKFKLILSIDELKLGENSISGYFAQDEKEIVVSLKDEDWISILVHEYNHFLQFIENDKTYISLEQGGNLLEELWNWVDGDVEFESIKRKNLVFKNVIAMELNCEIRSIQMIKKFELPIDLDEYIFVAHTYLHYYNYVKKYRTWFNDDIGVKDIIEIKELKNISLDSNFKSLPKGYQEIFKKYSK